MKSAPLPNPGVADAIWLLGGVMARLVKNIDTRQYGSLKAGRLLDGFCQNQKLLS